MSTATIEVLSRKLSITTIFPRSVIDDAYEEMTKKVEGLPPMSVADALEALPKILDVAMAVQRSPSLLARSVRELQGESR